MKDCTKFVGLDVSKDTIAVGVADEGREQPRFVGMFPNSVESVRSLVRHLSEDGVHLEFCYEAGPTGYGLYRLLRAMELSCTVVAPTLIPVRQGERVKTDKRDALRLAQLFRAGELVAVFVPNEENESLRDLVRAREDAVETVRGQGIGYRSFFSDTTDVLKPRCVLGDLYIVVGWTD